jgi:uncharacterized protein (TIGR02646 family)
MRKITKNFNQIPQKLQTCFAEKHDDLLQKKEKHKFDGSCYNTSITADLNALYHGKCAFCETNPEKRYGKKITIEHYRPKSEYWWLGYEWSNLFFACADCNAPKDSKFPLIAKNNIVKAPLIVDNQLDINFCKANSAHFLAEKPFFIHPEIDEPNAHFTLNLDGNLKGKTNRGTYTCDTLKLNRPNLTVNQGGRKFIIDELNGRLRKAILRLLDELEKLENDILPDNLIRVAFFDIFDDITNNDEKREFTFLYQVLSDRFSDFFIQKYTAEEAQIAELLRYSYYELYQKN